MRETASLFSGHRPAVSQSHDLTPMSSSASEDAPLLWTHTPEETISTTSNSIQAGTRLSDGYPEYDHSTGSSYLYPNPSSFSNLAPNKPSLGSVHSDFDAQRGLSSSQGSRSIYNTMVTNESSSKEPSIGSTDTPYPRRDETAQDDEHNWQQEFISSDIDSEGKYIAKRMKIFHIVDVINSNPIPSTNVYYRKRARAAFALACKFACCTYGNNMSRPESYTSIMETSRAFPGGPRLQSSRYTAATSLYAISK